MADPNSSLACIVPEKKVDPAQAGNECAQADGMLDATGTVLVQMGLAHRLPSWEEIARRNEEIVKLFNDARSKVRSAWESLGDVARGAPRRPPGLFDGAGGSVIHGHELINKGKKDEH